MIRKYFSALFSFRSKEHLAVSSCIGLAIGILPFYGFRGLVFIALLLALRLNIVTLLLGYCFSLIMPAVFTGISKFAGSMADSEASSAFIRIFFTDGFLSSGFYSENEISLFFTVNCIAVLVSTGLFYSLYDFLYKDIFKKEIKTYKYAVVTSLGMFIGAFPPSKYSLAVLGLVFLVSRFMLVPLIIGAFTGFVMVEPVLNFAVFAAGRNDDSYILSRIITGRFSMNELWSLAPGQQSISLLLIMLLILVTLSSYSGLKILYKKNAYDGGSTGKKYVFHDVTGTRWLLIKRIASTFLVITAVVVILFGLSTKTYAAENTDKYDASMGFEDMEKDSNNGLELPGISPDNPVDIYGFYVNWDSKSKKSFENNVDKINVLIPNWLYLRKDYSIEFKPDKEIDNMAFKNNIEVIPLINNYVGEKWDASLVHNLFDNKGIQKKFIDNITGIIKRNGYKGLNLDFEYIDQAHRTSYTQFVKALKESLSSYGLKLIIDAQASNPSYDYQALSGVADKLVLMIYDEHSNTTNYGSISSQNWFKDTLKSSGIPKDKLIAGMGLYGYDWETGSGKPGQGYTFSEIMQIASENKASFYWDAVSFTPLLKYTKNNREHVVHFNDAAVFYNQLKLSVNYGASGVGLWRLGSEDASIWDLMGMLTQETIKASGFIKPRIIEEPVIQGNGEIIKGYTRESQGVRVFKTDKDGWIKKENYLSYPKKSTVLSSENKEEKVVALTFDDGPDPLYTPRILDILKQYNIKATFFTIGDSGARYPDLLSRIYKEGHELGNHTYKHIDIGTESKEKIKQELKSTNRVIENSTGHGTILFRPPYDNGLDMSQDKALETFMKINDLGYVMVGNAIDSNDWKDKVPDKITHNVLNSLGNGNIILMHDGGGDRSATIEALPMIIKELQAQGYRFVGIGDLLDEKESRVMPSANLLQLALGKVDDFVNIFKDVAPDIITKFFFVSTAIGMLRFVFLLFFSTKQRRNYLRKRFYGAEKYRPRVSIVVAAYNEEKVICKTVNSLLQSDYDNLEVLVVNDGSKDGTASVVEEAYAGNEKVRLINKENGGKSSAVNRGFMEARGEIVIVLDADTIISKDAVSLMVRHFVDPDVAAVSGNVKVGNVRNIWTMWQHVEYVTGLNLERRAFDALNCITVVPGAIGAWRKELVVKAGYYKEDTLAEDADITLTFLQQGYKIVYEEGAKAFTEAPEDLKSLVKQRVRWAYGTLQCLWKHRGALFNKSQKSLGFVALPNTWLYQVVFQSLSPLTDILFFLGLISGKGTETVLTYVFFFIIDFAVTCYAFRLEKESLKPLLWLFIQRLVYRQLMTYIVYKSIVSALRGVKVGWNKLNRLGNVTQ